MSCRSQVSSAVLRTVSQTETSGHTPPPRVHTCFQVGDSGIRPQPMSFLPFPKGQKGLHPQGKACTLGSEPVYCRKSIKCCGVKMHSQPASVSPRTLFTGHGETPREEEGVPPRPHQPLQGRRQEHPADVPTCLPQVARCRGQDPTDFTGTQAMPRGPGGPGTE